MLLAKAALALAALATPAAAAAMKEPTKYVRPSTLVLFPCSILRKSN